MMQRKEFLGKGESNKDNGVASVQLKVKFGDGDSKQTYYVAILDSIQAMIWKVRDSLSSERNVATLGLEEQQEEEHSEDMNVQMKIKKFKEKAHHADSMGGFRYEAFHMVLGKPEVEQPDDLTVRLKFFLIAGRILGVLPFTGIFKKSYTQIYFYPKSAAAIQSIATFVVLVINLAFGLVDFFNSNKRNAFEIAQSLRGSIQFAWSCLIYLNFLVRGKKFLGLFYYWAKTSIFYTVEDRHLKRDVTFITVVILVSAIMENAVLHLEYIRELDNISGIHFENNTIGISSLETYYRRSHYHWAVLVPFHEIIAIIAFIQHKCMLYTCNLTDIMITVFSRAIYFKFRMLYKLGYEHLAKPLKRGLSLSKSSKIMNRHGWSQLAQDHKRLCDLLHEFESFFSPLIFGSYAVNIFYICVQLFDGISVDISAHSVVNSIYAPWSFLHIILRVYLVSMSAARINSYAHQIRAVLQECPIECYTPEIARLDRKVTTGPEIGLTGFGAFTITKPFILKIISVVFTFEIVLLQGKPSSSGAEC